jgi:hypothetical protein
MRLLSMGLAATLAMCAVMSGNAFSAPSRADFAGAASERMSMSATSSFADSGAEHLASSLVPDFKESHGLSRSERTHLAFATPPIPSALGASRQANTGSTSFSVHQTEQPPSFWLMGCVILFLIAYQLRRKHRLLRPHRFHEL